MLDSANGTSRLALPTKEVLGVLLQDQNPQGVEKKTLIRKLFGVVDPEDIEKVADALIRTEYIENHNSRYILTDRFKTEYQQKMREKNAKD